MNDHAQYWMNCADYDIESAKVMLDGKRYLYVGFLCHLTIEKALKAYLIRDDEEAVPPKIHNLIKLATLSGIHKNMGEKQRLFVSNLNPLNLEGRYPSYKADISAMLNAQTCNQLIKETEELLCWIKQQL